MNKNIFYILILILILITSELANTQLLFNFGNSGDTYGRSAAIDKDSNFIISGTFQGVLNCDLNGTKEINSNSGTTDVFFAKYDKRGNLLWAKSIGTTSEDIPTKVAVDFSGNVFITGYFGAADVPGRFIDLDPGPKEDKIFGNGGIDCFVIKLNKFGDYQWGFLLSNINGNTSDIIWDIVFNKSGQFYLSGNFAGLVDFNPLGSRKRISCPKNGYGCFTAKYDREGKNLWVSTIATNVNDPITEGYTSIDLDATDGCMISGNYRDTSKFEPDIDIPFAMVSQGGSDMFIARYTSSGNITMRGGFGGIEDDRISPGCLKIGNDGNAYLCGNFKGTSDFYPGFGETEITCYGADPEIFIASYTLSGSLRWVFNLPSETGDDKVFSMESDFDGNLIISGYFKGKTNFDPVGEKWINSNGTNGAGDAFIAKYDFDGHLLWINNYGDNLSGNDKFGRPQITIANSIINDQDDNTLVTGLFYGEVDFDPSDAVSELKTKGVFDLFFAKYDYDGNLWYSGGAKPAIRLISPNGGEVWNVDSVRVVSWFSRNIDYVNIDYSIDNGESWLNLGDSIPASSSSFTWIVENNPSKECRVRISDAGNNKLNDISNGKFIISSEVQPSRFAFSFSNPGLVSGKGIAADKKNNVIVTASFQGIINCDNGKGQKNLAAIGNSDMALAKYNELGELLWAFNVGSVGMNCEPNCLAIDGSDNIYVSGYFGKNGEIGSTMDFSSEFKVDTLSTRGGYDAFIAKYNSDGKYIWAIAFGNKNGISKEVINDMSVEKNGTIYVTGTYSGTVDFDPTKTEKVVNAASENFELFIAKFNNSGGLNWVIPIKTNMKDPEIEGLASIQSDGAGGCFLTGNFRDSINLNPLGFNSNYLLSKGESDIFAAHYKINNLLDWAMNIECPGNDIISDKCLKTGIDGNLYLSGVFNGKADFYQGLINKELTSYNNNEDIFLASYRTNGEFRWVKNFQSSTGLDKSRSLASDTAGNMLLTGYIISDIDFGEQGNSKTLTSNGKNGASDIFMAKLDNQGKVIWAENFGADTSGKENLSSGLIISSDKKNNILLTGMFFGENVDFAGGDEKYLMNSLGRNDGFFVKYFDNGNLWVQAADTAQLNLTKPNGGEIWQTGSNQIIKWFSQYIQFISLQYSTNNGREWIDIIEYLPASSNSYSWMIPDTPSDSCIIKIYDPDNLKRIDFSSRNFIIPEKYLRVIFPNGNEIIEGGSKNVILWNSHKVDYIDIEYTTNDGENWSPVVLSLAAASSSFSWNVKDIESSKCRIKVIDRLNNDFTDESDYNFRIKKTKFPAINLISPNGGEKWIINQTFKIIWTGNDLDKINIDFTLDNGKLWTNIVSDYDASLFEYDWLIPDSLMNSDSCLIKLSSTNDNSIFDISDSLFAINFGIFVEEGILNDIQNLKVYPIPSSDYINISFILVNDSFLDFKVFNNLGIEFKQTIGTKYNRGQNHENINISNLPAGIYYIRLINKKSVLVEKFIHIK